MKFETTLIYVLVDFCATFAVIVAVASLSVCHTLLKTARQTLQYKYITGLIFTQ